MSSPIARRLALLLTTLILCAAASLVDRPSSAAPRSSTPGSGRLAAPARSPTVSDAVAASSVLDGGVTNALLEPGAAPAVGVPAPLPLSAPIGPQPGGSTALPPATGGASALSPEAALAGKPAGQIALSVNGERGPLELSADGDSYRGTFEVKNLGPGELDITRVAVRTSESDPRTPPGVESSFEDGKTNVHLAAGASQRVSVLWSPANVTSVRELYGHIVVESNTGDHRAVAMGVHAERPGRAPWLQRHVLSALTFLPLFGVAGIFVARAAGRRDDRYAKWLTLGIMAVNLGLAVWLYLQFDPSIGKSSGNDGFQFIERAVWIRSLNVEYFVGIDGISVTMVLLTALVSFVGAIASFSIDRQQAGFFAMYCLLVTGMMGIFVALDLFLFYVFWEVMLLPMYFLIGIWGGPRKEYAAIKFFLYTMAGSALMLLAFIALYMNADPTYLSDGSSVVHSFAIPDLARVDYGSKNLLIFGHSLVKVCWIALFIGFAIKVPMFPLHTWLPDAHVEAPTAISVLLAGVLLKMGVYGILRINFGVLPEATTWAAPAIAAFGTINILYGAFCAMAQEDIKRLVAYSSVSHMGFCLLGMASLTPVGIEACIVQMFNHGTITAMLFLLVGVLYDRAHTREIGRFGGLAQEMPLYTAFVGFAFMASLGMPGLSGFIGELLTLVGAFPVYRLMTTLAALGMVLGAAYHLWALQRMFLGKFREEWRKSPYLEAVGGHFPEINRREIVSLLPLAVLVLVLGVWPRPLLTLIDRGVLDLFNTVSPPGPTQIALGGK
jgi:NADH-quinone oxidoreductase subunit M